MAKTSAVRPRVPVAVEVVLLTTGGSDLQVYLRKRSRAPFAGRLGLPGTLLRRGERTERAAKRVLDSFTGVRDAYLQQLYTFSEPRARAQRAPVTVAYYALFPTSHQRGNPYPLEDAWLPLRAASRRRLAFNHSNVLGLAHERLQGRLEYTSDAYRLLPPKFTIPQLQRVHELVLGQPIKADVFTKRALRNGLRSFRTRETAAAGTGGRPARLYRNPAAKVPK